MAEKPHYEIPTDADFDKFREEALSGGPEWELVHKGVMQGPRIGATCEVTTWVKKATNSSINIIKMFSEFKNVKPETLYEVLHDTDYRTAWDDKMIGRDQIEVLADNSEITYYAARAPPTVYNRDWVNQRSWRARPEQGEWIIFNRPAVHPACPPKSGFVRAEALLTGYLIRKSADGCTLNYLAQNDPKGWIPGWLINMLSKTEAPKLVVKLYEACLGYDEWKKEKMAQ